LKLQEGLKQTSTLTKEQIINLHAIVECEVPHDQLYTFHANISLGDKEEDKFPLETKQLLLRVIFLFLFTLLNFIIGS
jgi:hypothetical protein